MCALTPNIAPCTVRAGSFLVVPAGIHQRHASSPAASTTYVYAYGEWSAPLAHLPVLSAPTVAVRFCPLLLRLRPEPSLVTEVVSRASSQVAADGVPPKGNDSAVALTVSSGEVLAAVAVATAAVSEKGAESGQGLAHLPYRMLFAVATLDSVVIYDTQVRCILPRND